MSEEASKHLKWGKADKKKHELYDISRSKSCKRVIYYKQFDSFGKKEEGIQNNNDLSPLTPDEVKKCQKKYS